MTYMAPLDRAAWQVQQSKISCRLSQAIPKYGDAVFEARAGGEQQFFLQPLNNTMSGGTALLVASAPAWNPDLAPRQLGTIEVADSQRPVQLDDSLAQQLLQVLNRGLVPELSRPSNGGDGASVKVGVSPVRFRKAYGKYLQCVSQLLPASYDAVANTVLSFSSRDVQLDNAARGKLDLLARYVQASGTKAVLSIDALSTETPRRLENLGLAKQRARKVSDYLVARGVPHQRISLRYRGEHSPNRRGVVTVRLRR